MTRIIKVPTVANLRGVALYASAMTGAGVGYLGVGYDAGVVNVYTANPQFFVTFPLLKTNATLLGFNWALFTLGMFLGALGNGFIGTRWGRRDAIIISSIGMTAFSLQQALAHNLPTLMSARLLTGIFGGIILGTAPAYIAEISRTAQRAPLVFMDGIQSIGLAISFWLALPFGKILTDGGWRWPAGIQVILSGLSTLAYIFAPESPRYLVEIGDEDDALKVLRNIHHSEGEAQEALREIAAAVQFERQTQSHGFMALFANNDNCWRHRTILVLVLNVTTQACGVGIATYYAGNILVSVGLTGNNIHYALGGLGTSGAIFTFLGATTALKFGRIRTLLWTCAACSLGYTFIAIALSNIGTSWGPGLGAFGLYFFLSVWSYGFLPIQYTYPAEIAPLEIRMQLVSVGQSLQCLINFLVIMVSPRGFANIGWRYILPYIVFSAISCIAYMFFFPETGGLPLERINDLFRDGKVRMRKSTKDMLDDVPPLATRMETKVSVNEKGSEEFIA